MCSSKCCGDVLRTCMLMLLLCAETVCLCFVIGTAATALATVFCATSLCDAKLSQFTPMHMSWCPTCFVCSPYTDGNAVFNYIFMLIFFVDSCLSFRVAIIENDILITDAREIAKNYLRSVHLAASFLMQITSLKKENDMLLRVWLH